MISTQIGHGGPKSLIASEDSLFREVLSCGVCLASQVNGSVKQATNYYFNVKHYENIYYIYETIYNSYLDGWNSKLEFHNDTCLLKVKDAMRWRLKNNREREKRMS